MMHKLLSAFLVSFAVSAAVLPAAEVSLPSTIDFLVDDPNDPDDDADAFILSESERFRFSEFVFSPVASGGAVLPEETDVRVSLSESDRSVSLIFEFEENNSAPGGGAFGITLQYLAEVLDPSLKFRGHMLEMEGATQAEGWILINEVILADDDGVEVSAGELTTTLNVPGRPDALAETVLFSPTRSMTVHDKDISVNAIASDVSGATLMRMEQTFQVIPEPSSFMLLGLGILGLGMARWRFHRT